MPFFDPEPASPARHETIARIGRGGMAEVLLAATRSSGVVKLSVLKCLWPELAEDADFLAMFLDEARLSARLNHPNVVQTHDVIQHEGRLAIAMEYLEGQPLTAVLSRLGGSPELGLATRLRIITSVLAGLEYAHALADYDGTPLAVVHRDVSPQNVFVTYDGHVKLLDFGVAKTIAASHQTRPGGIKGKLAYLAPEAIRGDLVDRRGDIFSVGVLLWEIVAGRRLWGRGSEGVSGAWRLATGEAAPPLPEELDLPPALRAICAKALALNPAARFQTAAEMSAALEALGVSASDAHARWLGGLVSDAFAPERAQRRALVEFHLRAPPGANGGATFDYESFELSRHGETSGHELGSADYVVEVLPSIAAAPPTASVTAPEPPPRPQRVGRMFLATAAVACLALGAGVHLGRRANGSSPPMPWTAPAAPIALAPQTQTPSPAAAPTEMIIQPLLPEPREQQASTSHERREHHAAEAHAHRPRSLDLLSDEVLDLDGEPFGPQAGSRAHVRD